RMTDDSKFVFQWVIDNATAKFATGKVESEIFYKGGFEWTVATERTAEGRTVFHLKCASVHSRLWKCDADVGMTSYHVTGARVDAWPKAERACFNENTCNWILKTAWNWSPITGPNCLLRNDKVIFELHVNIISSERLDSSLQFGVLPKSARINC
ncbi:hypothetical protein PRIPAC_86079, partial [Pristionchus pacificus]